MKYYNSKLLIVEDVINFLKLYINEISFSKSSFETIRDVHINRYRSEVKTILLSPLDSSRYPSSLSNVEREEIVDVFRNLGKHDLETEINMCQGSLYKLQTLRDGIVRDKVTKGELRTKLIFILGLILLIILC